MSDSQVEAIAGEDQVEVAAAKQTRATAVITTVAMDDGRVVDFAGNRRLAKTIEITADEVSVRMDFLNGETRLFKVSPEMLLKFAGHGAAQKLGDEMTSYKDLDDAILAVDELMDRLNKGEWSVLREKNALAGASVLTKALVELSGKSPETIRAFLATKSQADKLALRTDPKVAVIVARLEAEKKPKKNAVVIDTDALLSELG